MKKIITACVLAGVALSAMAQPKHLSVKQFLKLSPQDTAAYVVSGVVTKVRNSSAGSFYLKDKTGTMLVYGIQDPSNPGGSFKQMDIIKGDTVTVQGRFLLYAGQTKEMKDGLLLSKADGPEHSLAFLDRLDRKPAFQGKEGAAAAEAFQEWVQARVKQPADGATGTVVVSYAVGRNGKVQEVQVQKGAASSLNQEVVRVVQQSPKWKPGVLDGAPLRMTNTVTIHFP